ncbi:MAG TPA: ATP-binding cassette domain-containing protein [Oscillatoriaceae cyanobacterium]
MDHRTEALFSVRQIRHRYAAREILQGVSLTIHEGDRLGLLGVNGAGKTTLLKIMAGIEKPDAGEIAMRRGLRVGYLPQEFELDPARTVRDGILEGAADTRALLAAYQALSERLTTAGDDAALLAEHTALAEQLERQGAWGLDRLVETVMHKLRVPAGDRLCGTLSGGESRRVSLARTLVGQPELLILDEPTNHLDADSIAWLEDYLTALKGSCVLVTHDRYFLDRVVNRMVELERGELTSYDGNYTDYLEAKAARAEALAHAEQSRQNTLRRELAWVRKQPRARQAKSKAREEAYYALAAQDGPPPADEIQLRIPTGEVRLGKKVVELADVGHGRDGRQFFSGLTLSLQAGDRIGVVGANGLGKTTLMRLVQGLETPNSGTIEIGPNTRFVYADQGRSRLDVEKTLVDEVADGGRYVTVEDEQMTVRSYLRRFLFTDEQINTPIAKFSGGEQNRAQLAKLLAKGGNVLILDEPTNDLDLPTLRALEDALSVYPGAAFVVSHDRYFLNRVATAILAFEGDGRVVFSLGSYDRYLEQRAAREEAAPVVESPKPAARPARENAVRKLSYKENQELEGMEAAIEAAEATLADLESRLADPALYAERAETVPALLAEADAARSRVEGLYRRWEELEQLRAGLTV